MAETLLEIKTGLITTAGAEVLERSFSHVPRCYLANELRLVHAGEAS